MKLIAILIVVFFVLPLTCCIRASKETASGDTLTVTPSDTPGHGKEHGDSSKAAATSTYIEFDGRQATVSFTDSVLTYTFLTDPSIENDSVASASREGKSGSTFSGASYSLTLFSSPCIPRMMEMSEDTVLVPKVIGGRIFLTASGSDAAMHQYHNYYYYAVAGNESCVVFAADIQTFDPSVVEGKIEEFDIGPVVAEFEKSLGGIATRPIQNEHSVEPGR